MRKTPVRKPHTEETKRKIREANKKKAAERGPEWGEMMKKINSNPEKIAKTKETWRLKREARWNEQHRSTAKYWYLQEVGKCEECNITEWRGKKIPLEVHHLDGNNENNSKENLQVLCPNCHSLTDSWRKKKS
jgi:hypothetical protein